MRGLLLLLHIIPALVFAQRQDPLSQVKWISGSANCDSNSDPPIQVLQYDDDTYIFRQNKCIHYEAPFMYLFIGKKQALLVDTGAKAAEKSFPLFDTVEKILAKRGSLFPLKVIHSHSHGDHHASDFQFRNKKNVEVVGATKDSIISFLKISHWPEEMAEYDLGGRVITIIPIPGHDQSSIALYDPGTRWLLTGDSVYPGRLYVRDWAAFRASINRLAGFCEKRPVSFLLGNHIEMTTKKGVDYPTGTTFQPDEHILQLSPALLKTLRNTLGDHPSRVVFDDFIVEPIE